MFKFVILSALIMAAYARPGEYVRVQRSPHHHHHGGFGLTGSIAQAESFGGGFGGRPFGGYGGNPYGYGGFPGGYGGYPGGYGGYPSFGGGYSDASAQSGTFDLGFDWRR